MSKPEWMVLVADIHLIHTKVINHCIRIECGVTMLTHVDSPNAGLSILYPLPPINDSQLIRNCRTLVVCSGSAQDRYACFVLSPSLGRNHLRVRLGGC